MLRIQLLYSQAKCSPSQMTNEEPQMKNEVGDMLRIQLLYSHAKCSASPMKNEEPAMTHEVAQSKGR